MNTRILPSLAIGLILSLSLSGQTYVDEQTSLVVKISADWCPNCGGWGWEFFKALLEDSEEDAIFLTAHHSGGLRTDVGQAMATNYDVTYQPYFIVNNDLVDVSSSTAAQRRPEVRAEIVAHNAQSPSVRLGMDVMYGDRLSANVKVQFTEAVSGEYYLGIYGLEDHVIWPQSNQGNNADHRYVLRRHADLADDNEFGMQIASGSIAAGMEYTSGFGPFGEDLGIDDQQDPANKALLAVVWRKVGEDYRFVNAVKVDGDHFLTSTDDPGMTPPADFFTSFENGSLYLSVRGIRTVRGATFTLHDLHGRLVHRQDLSDSSDTDRIFIPYAPATPRVMIATLETDSGRISRKVLAR